MTTEPDGPQADDDPAWDAPDPGLGEFVAGLRGFAAGDAPTPPLELEAVFAGVLPAFPEPDRRRLRLGSPLVAAGLGALLITVGLGMADRLPGPAQGVVSALESGLRPLHLLDPAGGPLGRPSPRVRTEVPARSTAPAPGHHIPLFVASTTLPDVRTPQDLRPSQVRTVAALRSRPVHPAHPAAAHPAHPAHPTHPTHPAHPARPGSAAPKAHPLHPARAHARHAAHGARPAAHGGPGGWRRLGLQPPR